MLRIQATIGAINTFQFSIMGTGVDRVSPRAKIYPAGLVRGVTACQTWTPRLSIGRWMGLFPGCGQTFLMDGPQAVALRAVASNIQDESGRGRLIKPRQTSSVSAWCVFAVAGQRRA